MTPVLTWGRDALERALSTAAQVLVIFGGGDVFNLLTVDWKAAFGVVGGAFVASLLKSVAARKTGNPDSASLAD